VRHVVWASEKMQLVVQACSFHNELSIGNPMSKDRSRGKCFLERVESIYTGGVELPRNVLSGEACQVLKFPYLLKASISPSK